MVLLHQLTAIKSYLLTAWNAPAKLPAVLGPPR